MDRAILRPWLAAGFLAHQIHHPTTTGTPQGGVISPVLMNLTLDGLETLLAKRFPPRSGAKVNFVRYADDFIITGNSQELLENEVTPLVTQFLKERGWQLSERKTKVTHVNEGFDFLGKHIRKYSNGKLLTKPRAPQRASLPRRDQSDLQRKSSYLGGTPVITAQPDDSGLGEFPSRFSQRRDFQVRGLPHLPRNTALDSPPTSAQNVALVLPQVPL